MKQQVSGLGVEAQREIIKNHLKDNPLITEFVETESGKKSNRPKLMEALALCRKTNSVLIVAKLDRLSRNVAFTSKLLESDVEIVFCDFPQANRLILHIISSIAEYEANLFAAELLIDDKELLKLLNGSDKSFFGVAKELYVPAELLDFKFRILKNKGYHLEAPYISRPDFLKETIPGSFD